MSGAPAVRRQLVASRPALAPVLWSVFRWWWRCRRCTRGERPSLLSWPTPVLALSSQDFWHQHWPRDAGASEGRHPRGWPSRHTSGTCSTECGRAQVAWLPVLGRKPSNWAPRRPQDRGRRLRDTAVARQKSPGGISSGSSSGGRCSTRTDRGRARVGCRDRPPFIGSSRCGRAQGVATPTRLPCPPLDASQRC